MPADRAAAARIAVTGAAGFVGRALCRRLESDGRRVRRVVREALAIGGYVGVGELGPGTDWSEALAGVECVVHCAGRAHVVRETAVDPLAEFRRVNVEATRRLAEQAVAIGVRRLVYVSSIGVHGVQTNNRAPFRHDEAPAPIEPYAVSKLEAERELVGLAAVTGLELVIVRPPLVYGPGVGANFLRLLRLVDRGWPLPFGAVRGLRSLVGIDNLVDLLARCADAPEAAGQTFLASDGEDFALPDLIRMLARHLGRPARLLPVPPHALVAAARLVGMAGTVARMTSSLQVDIAHTCCTLEWQPPMSAEDGLAATARWYGEQFHRR